MGCYEMSIQCAIRHITIAREKLVIDNAEEFDIDWAVDQFDRAITILEQMREYKEGLVNNGD